MTLRKILLESLKTLKSRPSIFLPRLISTGLSTLWFLGFLEMMGSYSFYLATMPLILVLGVFVSVMLAEMVKVKDEPDMLKKSFYLTLGKWKRVIAASVFFLVTSFLISLPSSLGLIAFSYTGNLIFLLGVLASFLLIMGVSFAMYFLPVSLVEHRGIMKSFKDSARTSYSNSREVSFLLLLSLVLLGFAFLSQGIMENLGYIGFAFSRLTSAVATTYLFVVSPEYYLEEKNVENEGETD